MKSVFKCHFVMRIIKPSNFEIKSSSPLGIWELGILTERSFDALILKSGSNYIHKRRINPQSIRSSPYPSSMDEKLVD